jgi:hypothetical protein
LDEKAQSAGLRCAGAKIALVPDLSAMLLRKTVTTLESGRPRCNSCDRTPLVGEHLHEMDTGRTLCELCRSALPHADRESVRTELVHASERHLRVAPRAA